MIAPSFQIEPSNALPRWQRRTIAAAAVGLLASGLAWIPLHYLWGAGAGALPHPGEIWLMRCHGLSAVNACPGRAFLSA